MSLSRAAASAARTPVWPPSADLPPLYPGDRVHLVGIGGAGMSGLARVLAQLGLTVSGSDRGASAVLADLAGAGIAVHARHDAAALPDGCALVVRSPAVPDDNPELAAARRAGIPITKRAVLLGALLDLRLGIAVAGTHGKTTTSGLVAWVLTTAGFDPTFFVGGELPNLGTNARPGRGDYLVLEADEYDRSFLHGHPLVAVVTNVEHDHPDIYPTFDDVLDAFRAFVGRVRPAGRVVGNAASPGALAVLGAATVPVDLYHVAGDPEPPAGTPIAWRATDLAVHGPEQLFDVRRDGTCLGTFAIRLPGRHNVGNALAAVAVAQYLGIDVAATRVALATYQGAARRFEILGHARHVTVVDDYAHHPTEIAAALAAARVRFPGARVWAVVQPHTHSRVAALVNDFAVSLADADRVILTPVYAAREAPDPTATSEHIAARCPGAVVASSAAAAADLAAAGAASGDVLLFLGAGDIDQSSRPCLARLGALALDDLREQAAQAGLGGTVTAGTLLAELTSLKVGGPGDLVVRAGTTTDLAGWWQLGHSADVPVHVLGRGTNVLVAGGGVRGLVLVNRAEQWSLELDASGEQAVVTAASGVTLAALAQALARAGWAGLEHGVGIPGSVGAGVVTNAGAHGWEMADSFLDATILAVAGRPVTWAAPELAFRYRGSALKGDTAHLVVSVRLSLRRDDPAAILARIERFTAHRRATQPATPSVGSMFKNPPGDFAGRLIEQAGLKGQRVGGAEISTKHANFFLNRGDASAADIQALVRLARARVHDLFGVDLELEIELLGDDHAP
jgi:UDP-N-acetylmuramate--alanine ligase